MRRSKRQVLIVLDSLLERPKWWNEAFAKYNQKKLHAWATEVQAKAFEPRLPKFDVPETPSHDFIYGELYQPYVARNEWRFII